MLITLDIAWPGTTIPLPFYEFNGASLSASIASDYETSRIARRSRFTRSFVKMAVRWQLDDDQLAAFEEFFTDTLGNGVSCFSIDLRFPKQSELSPWSVRFESGYQLTKSDGPHLVEATLILVQPLVISDPAS